MQVTTLRRTLLLLALACTAQSSRAQDRPRVPAIYALPSGGSKAWELASLPDYPFLCSPELSPDGTRVAVDGWREGENLQNAHLLIINLENRAVQDLGKGAMPSWSPDGTWIACSKYGGGVFIRSVIENDEQLIDAAGWGIQWSPDGKRLAYARGGNLIIHELATSAQSEVFPRNKVPYDMIYWNCAWSPDSQQVCFKGRRRSDGAEELAIVTATGAAPQHRVLRRAEDINPDIAWHPDGSRIVVPKAGKPGQHGQMLMFDLTQAGAPKPLAGQPTDRHNGGMCWSRDGELLVFMSSQ
jgi:Tol biopolymer transport system component